MKTAPENSEILSTIEALKKASRGKKGGIWRSISHALLAGSRKRAQVNLSKLDEVCAEGATVVVPGKVLASGEVKKKLSVAALSFSDAAEAGIKKAGGKCTNIKQLISSNPKGTGVMIVK